MFLRIYTGVTTWWSDLKVRAEEEKGATAVEYALMAVSYTHLTLPTKA